MMAIEAELLVTTPRGSIGLTTLLHPCTFSPVAPNNIICIICVLFVLVNAS